MIITIDGYSCQGKSTVARTLAERLGWEFFSIGAVFRYLAVVYNTVSAELDSEREAVGRAVALMHETGIESMPSVAGARGMDIERALEVLAKYPSVEGEIARKIYSSFEGRSVVLDGRIGFLIFPDAYRSYYFVTSLERRALFASRSRGLSLDEAREYITFRDSFEHHHTLTDRVRTVELDSFDTVDDIVAHLLSDIPREK